MREPRSVSTPPLTDRFGRSHRALRLSVTDRCNLRCRYCMPADGMAWLARETLATADELVRLAGMFVGLGISDIRVTGGRERVRAVECSQEDRAVLQLASGEGVLQVERLAYAGDQAVEWRRSLLRGSAYELTAGWGTVPGSEP